MIDVNFRVVGLTELQASFSSLPAVVSTRLRGFMAEAGLTLRAMVQQNIVGYFNSTGPLYQSVRSEISEDTSGITGRVYTEGVVYARIQEQGGTVQIPEIVPVNAGVLAFSTPARMAISAIASAGGGSGAMVFAMRAKAHPVTIPEHPYARRALADYRQPFRGGIREVVQAAIGSAGLQMAAE
jgi:hypothetical protein